VTGAGIAYAEVPDADGIISACYGRTGTLRVIEAGQQCSSKEQPLVWNQQGVPGEAGAPGEQGPEGAVGPAGSDGAGRLVASADPSDRVIPSWAGNEGLVESIPLTVSTGGFYVVMMSGAISTVSTCDVELWGGIDGRTGLEYSNYGESQYFGERGAHTSVTMTYWLEPGDHSIEIEYRGSCDADRSVSDAHVRVLAY
jgi:hypothetical protein